MRNQAISSFDLSQHYSLPLYGCALFANRLIMVDGILLGHGAIKGGHIPRSFWAYINAGRLHFLLPASIPGSFLFLFLFRFPFAL